MVRIGSAFVLGASLFLAACGSNPRTVGGVVPTQNSDAQWQGRSKIGKAINFLNEGNRSSARNIVLEVLARQPGDQLARSLLDQIDKDPKMLLGAPNFSYTVKAGESFSSLAGRFLGNPSLFYALARYNSVDTPSSLQPGAILRIPGHEKKEATPVLRNVPKAIDHAVAEKVVPAKPATDPRRAQQLRAAGLLQLNRGQIARAVEMLQQANSLDPANLLIRRDLERAIRIRRTVDGK